MAQVAIVGTEGVGKTVLMTMMAWAFKRDRDGVRMIPMSRQTSEHVARVWTVLNGGDWPPSTPQGQLLTLHWELHVDGAPVCDLRCLEIAGQDFRRLFADEEVNELTELPEQLQRLAGFIQEADVIVFLANLRDFAGEPDVQREDENQWALKFAMDWVRRQARPRRCCLVFTQSDQYGELKRQVGGWDKLAEKYLPYVDSAHVRTGAMPVMAVSAVGGTKVAVRDGRPLRVPDGKWLCKGLNPLAKWIGESAAMMEDQKPNVPPAVNPPESSSNVARPGPPSLPTGTGSLSDTLKSNRRFVLAALVVAALGLLAVTTFGLVMSAIGGPEIIADSRKIELTSWPWPLSAADEFAVSGQLVHGLADGTVYVRADVWWDGNVIGSETMPVQTDDGGNAWFRIPVKVPTLPDRATWNKHVTFDARVAR